jgi:arsenate reductase
VVLQDHRGNIGDGSDRAVRGDEAVKNGGERAAACRSARRSPRKLDIDISAETPKILTIDAVMDSDVCITMGCGDTCPVFPGKRSLDLEDPAGQGVEAVRPIRDEIKVLIDGLIKEIAAEPVA